MRLLILGGTWFVGRAMAEAALAAGWEVTCFNRGRSGRDVAGVVTIRGDRTVEADVDELVRHGPWDAALDTGAYAPADARVAVDALSGLVGSFALVSTVSAYQEWPSAAVDEASPLWSSRVDAAESDSDIAALARPIAYGTLKAGCEQLVRDRYGDGRTLLLRPGVVLGPAEYVGRLPALLRRAAQGGRMLATGYPDRAIQPVDVRDLADFIVGMIGGGNAGSYNVVAPSGYGTYGDLLGACVEVTHGGTELVWLDDRWLVSQGAREWTELVLWRGAPGTWSVDGRRAERAGLRCRPLVATVTDTWEWLQREQPVEHPRQGEHGLAADREAELLAAWDRRVRAGPD